MSGKIKNCKGPFFIYEINEFRYAGITTDLRKRMNKHKSEKVLNYTPTYKIIAKIDSFEEAISFEEKYQTQNKLSVSKVKNQNGKNNPIARAVLDKATGFFFYTIKEACEALNINYSSARHRVRDNNFRLKRI